MIYSSILRQEAGNFARHDSLDETIVKEFIIKNIRSKVSMMLSVLILDFTTSATQSWGPHFFQAESCVLALEIT